MRLADAVEGGRCPGVGFGLGLGGLGLGLGRVARTFVVASGTSREREAHWGGRLCGIQVQRPYCARKVNFRLSPPCYGCSNARSSHNGTWSEGFSQVRTWRSMPT